MRDRFKKITSKLSRPRIAYPLGTTLGAVGTIVGIRMRGPIIAETTQEIAKKLMQDPSTVAIGRSRLLGTIIIRIVP